VAAVQRKPVLDGSATPLICNRRIDRNLRAANGQGAVASDVEATHPHDERAASCDILTLVAKKA